jgi:hypothetical protein
MLRLAIGLLTVVLAFAAGTIRLYLKDGGYHLVREYQVAGDRVRYYSVERGDWEEIPLSLVDLKRTEGEIKAREEELKEEAKVISQEERVEREQIEEAARVPGDPGVYRVAGTELRPIPQAEPKVVSNKRRSVLKVITPIPILSGKATVELDGETSQNAVATDRPEFYLRLAALERFAMVRLTPHKKNKSRIVEKWDIVPVSNELIEERQEVSIFRQQAGEGLYKIWPTEPLKPGEYAVVEFTDGKGNVQVWDFSYRVGGSPEPAKSKAGR